MYDIKLLSSGQGIKVTIINNITEKINPITPKYINILYIEIYLKSINHLFLIEQYAFDIIAAR